MQVKTRSLGTRMALRAGAVLTLVAGGLAATATAAFATSNAATVLPSHGPSGGGYNVVLTETVGATFSGGTGPYTAQFNTAATCPTTIGTPTPLTGTSTVSGIVAVTGIAKPGGATLTVMTPAGLTLPSGSGPTALSICVYDTGASDALIANADAAFTLNPDATPSPSSGGSGGNYAVTVNSNAAPFSISNPQVQFQAKVTGGLTVCNATAQGASTPTANGSNALTGGVVSVPAANVTVNATDKLTVMVPSTLAQPTTPSLVFSSTYLVCVYNAAGTALLAESPIATPFVLSGNTMLSQTSGSSTGGNTVTMSAASGTVFATGTQNVRLVTTTFAASGCPTTLGAAADATTITPASTRYVSPTKVAFTLPTTGLPTTTTQYRVCAYDPVAPGAAGSNPLVASGFGTYTIGQVPTVDTVSPATGPAQGGSTITVKGANFPVSGMTATLGGTALTNITVGGTLSAGNTIGTQFTATVPSHAPGGPYALAVTTSGGTVTANGLFTFTNGITVTPKSAPNTSTGPTGLDITGVGFSDLTFSTAYNTNSSNAHVYLVKGAYASGTSTVATAVKPNPQTTECVDVLVVGDTELLCNLYLGGNLNAVPTATTRTLSSCANYPSATATAPLATVAASTYIGPSASSVSTCTFTQADVGNTITAGASGAAIPANATVITAVSSNGVATLSKASAAAITSTTTPITTSTVRTMTDAATTLNATSLAANTAGNASTFFTSADVGKVVSGANFPTGTYIVSVSGGVATMSNAATATSTTGTLSIYNPTPVPNGTYTVTIVSSGAPGAGTLANYYQTIISSGSTFTVADYLH